MKKRGFFRLVDADCFSEFKKRESVFKNMGDIVFEHILVFNN